MELRLSYNVYFINIQFLHVLGVPKALFSESKQYSVVFYITESGLQDDGGLSH